MITVKKYELQKIAHRVISSLELATEVSGEIVLNPIAKDAVYWATLTAQAVYNTWEEAEIPVADWMYSNRNLHHVVIDGVTHQPSMQFSTWVQLMQSNDWVDNEGMMTEKLEDLILVKKPKTYPVTREELVSIRLVRNGKGWYKGQPLKGLEAQEDSPFGVHLHILDVANKTVEVLREEGYAKTSAIFSQEYVIAACNKLRLEGKTKDLFSLYAFEWRGRKGSASKHGPDPQGADAPRALYCLMHHTLDTKYDSARILAMLQDELKDLASDMDWEELLASLSTDLDEQYKFAVEHGRGLVTDKFDAQGLEIYQPGMRKSLCFIRVANLYRELKNHIDLGAPKPLIDWPLGKDATCSGPSNAAMVFNSHEMMQRCGFAPEVLKDAYQAAITAVEAVGITGFERNVIKYPFMAIFFSMGPGAFATFTKDSEPFFDILHGTDGMTRKRWEAIVAKGNNPFSERGRAFHGAIRGSFTKKIIDGMDAISSALCSFKFHLGGGRPDAFPRFDGHIKWFTCEGFPVDMATYCRVDLNGHKGKASNIDVTFNGHEYPMVNFAINTKTLDRERMAGTVFVNWNHSVDGTICSLINQKLVEKGVKNIVAVHDCNKTDASHQDQLDEAIVETFMEYYGTDEIGVITPMLPYGNDPRGLLQQGIAKVLLPDHALAISNHSYVKRGDDKTYRAAVRTGTPKGGLNRRTGLMTLKGVTVKEAILDPKSTYFK